MNNSITGTRIKERRKELGLSADTLAKMVGVSRATIFRYENGAIEKVPADFLLPLARCLGVSMSYLLGVDADSSVDMFSVAPTEIQPANTIRIAGRDGSLVERQLTDEQLALFQSMLDQMKPIDDENI